MLFVGQEQERNTYLYLQKQFTVVFSRNVNKVSTPYFCLYDSQKLQYTLINKYKGVSTFWWFFFASKARKMISEIKNSIMNFYFQQNEVEIKNEISEK